MSHDKDETPCNEVFGKIDHSFCSITHCEILTLRNNLQSTNLTIVLQLGGIFQEFSAKALKLYGMNQLYGIMKRIYDKIE